MPIWGPDPVSTRENHDLKKVVKQRRRGATEYQWQCSCGETSKTGQLSPTEPGARRAHRQHQSEKGVR